MHATLDEAAHVVVYAERGRGKTSLINLIGEALRALGFMVATYTCAADDDFDAVMCGLLRSLPRSFLAVTSQRGEEVVSGCEAALPPRRLQPYDILHLGSRLTGRRLVLVVDEFDRVTDIATRTRIADTIKLLSDRAAQTLFIVVGVSENLEELLGRHPSIQRNVVGVPLPLLTDAEIRILLERGAQDANLVIPTQIREMIVGFARGVPYIAQLLALHVGYSAFRDARCEVTGKDLTKALETAVSEADPRIIAHYNTLTEGGRDLVMREFLWRLAAGKQDVFGRFSVENLSPDHMLIGGESVALALWERLIKDGIVRSCKSGGLNVFSMTEATFANYVLMRSACDGLGPLGLELAKLSQEL
jgi:hypothetical protein